jgi:4-hydroxy-4-methyl-2-oxoglutarate aldolase
MEYHIIKHVPLLTKELREAFMGHSAATIHEVMGRRGAMNMIIKPLVQDMKVCGRAVTVQCHPGDNIMLIKAVSMGQPGDVLVCDMGKIDEGPFGEVLAEECVSRGIAGLVISSAVRDGAAIINLGFPVFSAGLCISGTSKSTLGTINNTISCGGVIVSPGDIILGDNDGVVVIPLPEAQNVLEKAEKRVNNEAFTIQRLRNGESLFNIYEYQKVFDSLGCMEEPD